MTTLDPTSAVSIARQLVAASGDARAASVDEQLAKLSPWPPQTIEQYKILEARIDRLSTTQFGLWATGVAALGVFTALKERTISPPALLWSVGLVSSLFTVLGWQCAIGINLNRQRLEELFAIADVPREQRHTLQYSSGQLARLDSGRFVGELVVWPTVLTAAVFLGTWWGFQLGALRNDVVGVGAIVAAFLVPVALGGQSRRYARSFREKPADASK